jgi:aryl-alcohol dehydrogenase-like predicted oxidoreductase
VDADLQFETLKALRDEGKVREVGLSQVDVGQIAAARKIVPIVSVQNLYNIAQREDDDVVDYCEGEGIGFIPWFPLGSGKFSGVGSPIDEVAATKGATVTQICLAWLLGRSPVMLPIPGTSTIAHLEENCGSIDVTLSDDEYQALTDARKSIRRWAMSN